MHPILPKINLFVAAALYSVAAFVVGEKTLKPEPEGIRVRMSPTFSRAITVAAADDLCSRSAWIRRACRDALAKRNVPVAVSAVPKKSSTIQTLAEHA